MTYNNRFLEEARELERRWAQTGLLQGVDERYSRATTAVMLESCRLLNEGPCPRCGITHGRKKVDWKTEGF